MRELVKIKWKCNCIQHKNQNIKQKNNKIRNNNKLNRTWKKKVTYTITLIIRGINNKKIYKKIWINQYSREMICQGKKIKERQNLLKAISINKKQIVNQINNT